MKGHDYKSILVAQTIFVVFYVILVVGLGIRNVYYSLKGIRPERRAPTHSLVDEKEHVLVICTPILIIFVLIVMGFVLLGIPFTSAGPPIFLVLIMALMFEARILMSKPRTKGMMGTKESDHLEFDRGIWGLAVIFTIIASATKINENVLCQPISQLKMDAASKCLDGIRSELFSCLNQRAGGIIYTQALGVCPNLVMNVELAIAYEIVCYLSIIVSALLCIYLVKSLDMIGFVLQSLRAAEEDVIRIVEKSQDYRRENAV